MIRINLPLARQDSYGTSPGPPTLADSPGATAPATVPYPPSYPATPRHRPTVRRPQGRTGFLVLRRLLAPERRPVWDHWRVRKLSSPTPGTRLLCDSPMDARGVGPGAVEETNVPRTKVLRGDGVQRRTTDERFGVDPWDVGQGNDPGKGEGTSGPGRAGPRTT